MKGGGGEFLELRGEGAPFVVRPAKPVMGKVPPSAAAERARLFLATAGNGPAPVNLEQEQGPAEEGGRVITLDLGLAPAEEVPKELYRKE